MLYLCGCVSDFQQYENAVEIESGNVLYDAFMNELTLNLTLKNETGYDLERIDLVIWIWLSGNGTKTVTPSVNFTDHVDSDGLFKTGESVVINNQIVIELDEYSLTKDDIDGIEISKIECYVLYDDDDSTVNSTYSKEDAYFTLDE